MYKGQIKERCNATKTVEINKEKQNDWHGGKRFETLKIDDDLLTSKVTSHIS